MVKKKVLRGQKNKFQISPPPSSPNPPTQRPLAFAGGCGPLPGGAPSRSGAGREEVAFPTDHLAVTARAMYYVQGFDPALIISQIVSMQALLYMHLGLWLCVLTALGGSEVSSLSLGNFFSSSAMSISFAGGWIAIIACFLNALAGAFFLCLVVERAKKCLDFTTTAHLLHLCFCVMYDGFPAGWEWCAHAGGRC